MDYQKKADEIWKAIEDMGKVKFQFPFMAEMIRYKEEQRKKYYARINSNIFLHGKSALIFDDIDYNP